MPANTPLLTLPYPVAADPADVPHDVQALANRLDVRPSNIVSALPGSPVDGQTIDYQADAANGVVWRLRYRAASASPYKWEFVGGSPLKAATDASEAVTAANAFQSLSGPNMTLPLAGDYDVEFIAMFGSNTANAGGMVRLSVGGTVRADTQVGWFSTIAGQKDAGYSVSGGMARRLTGVAAATAVFPQYWTGVAGSFFVYRLLTAQPVRVG